MGLLIRELITLNPITVYRCANNIITAFVAQMYR